MPQLFPRSIFSRVAKQEFDKNANDNVYFSELYYCV